ncbi:hypothetical protein [Streptomyces sp. TP-A0874]|uniref:hypothetical protein n=1 Tax=Streptomyces sp. TP-A0874 TaxID=549819 RepID=UPI000853C729|nr:hypothetical protein [Streptomyces sp. TP-A0874]
MHDERDIEAGIAQLEGYLRSQTDIAEAQQAAEEFADHLPWLTTDQRAELVGLYTEDRLVLTRQYLRRVVGRCTELRAEYSERYEELRRRLICLTVTAVLGSIALSSCTVLLQQAGG